MDLGGLLVWRLWRVGSGCSGGDSEVWSKRGSRAYDKSMGKTSNMAAARRQRESCAGLEVAVAVHG